MPVDIYSNLAGDGLESEEVKLYNLVNEYRSQNGLPAIPLSKALTTVANRHVQDVAENLNIQFNDGRNPHSWSWGAFDLNNPATYTNMWDAPQRLKTGYPGRGYENFFRTSASAVDAVTALESWKTSPGHNDVILNRGSWQNRPWNAIGIGIYKGNAVLWFGEETDPTGTPTIAQTTAPPPLTETRFGTEGNDILTGTANRDVIVALGGDDRMTGNAGDDELYGNQGKDNISGDDGNDIVLAGRGEDLVTGGLGDDIHLNGNLDNDEVRGGDGNDKIFGGRGNDTLLGENGNDVLYGDLDSDVLIGGAGADTYVLRGDAPDIFYYTDGEDKIGISAGLAFDFSFVQGADEWVKDGLVETQIRDRTTGQIWAVLPGIQPTALTSTDFVSV
jgi:serralysin